MDKKTEKQSKVSTSSSRLSNSCQLCAFFFPRHRSIMIRRMYIQCPEISFDISYIVAEFEC